MRYILHWVREGLVHCPDSPRGCGECERLLWQFAVQSGLTTTTHKLIVIDPYFDDSVLALVAQKRPEATVLVVKNSRKNQLHEVDVAQFNAQYGDTLTVKESDKFHDRFLIIDKSTLVHVGASLNHLGKKCFALRSEVLLDTKRGRFVAAVRSCDFRCRLQHDCCNLVWQSGVTFCL